MVNMKLALFAVLATAATFVIADDPEVPATVPGNSTETSTNSTIPATNGTATNGTATDGTATNGTETPEPSGGSTRRRRQICEYGCPEWDCASHPFDMRTNATDTFTCSYASAGTCDYRMTGGVISKDNDFGQCHGAAVPLTAGCSAGQSTNGGVEKRKQKRGTHRSSRDIQFDALVKRLGL
ncbi:hypothetical protein AURDEDRAFT_128195 [Auricularia subglabra TFB-10046 SS5]|uniref:Uncharacterized protein n=1 Tax=Auricularia subglabra (strain TFB-10046 / SS5) TaxID=717982 RepID=J0D1E4_AURST|nr:hypothetical protein AURDEDRAFT_128195 [Auricularia subglabra TFB-10046 SS5]